MSTTASPSGQVSFLQQTAPVDERGRALYAVSRSVVRALLDQMSTTDLTVVNTDRQDVTLRQLSSMARLQRDKGMRGDGFEWAVHEAVVGQEPTVVEPLLDAMRRASRRSFRSTDSPKSLLFGYERAKYLGFLDAIVQDAAEKAVLLPDTQGRPPHFDTWVREAARGQVAESVLPDRLRKVWKTDSFVSDEARHRHLAVTIKSNVAQLEVGAGLRLGVVPEAPHTFRGVRYHKDRTTGEGLWLAVLPDPDGFMGLFNDGYEAVAEAVTTLGKHARGTNYWQKPTPMARRSQEQLEKYPDVRVVEIEHALDEAAQQDLVDVQARLVSVEAPPWLHLGAPDRSATAIAPKPSFVKLN